MRKLFCFLLLLVTGSWAMAQAPRTVMAYPDGSLATPTNLMIKNLSAGTNIHIERYGTNGALRINSLSTSTGSNSGPWTLSVAGVPVSHVVTQLNLTAGTNISFNTTNASASNTAHLQISANLIPLSNDLAALIVATTNGLAALSASNVVILSAGAGLDVYSNLVGGKMLYWLTNTGTGGGAATNLNATQFTFAGGTNSIKDGSALTNIAHQGNITLDGASIIANNGGNVSLSGLYIAGGNPDDILMNNGSDVAVWTSTNYFGLMASNIARAATNSQQVTGWLNFRTNWVVGAAGNLHVTNGLFVGTNAASRLVHFKNDGATPLRVERASSSPIAGTFEMYNPETTDSNAVSFDFLADSTGVGASAGIAYGTIRSVINRHAHSTRSGDMLFLTSSNGNTERMRILGNGLVGINTNLPQANLHVHGTFLVNGTNNTTGALQLNGTNVEAQIAAQVSTNQHSIVTAGTNAVVVSNAVNGFVVSAIPSMVQSNGNNLARPTTVNYIGFNLLTNSAGTLHIGQPPSAVAGADTQVQFNDGGSFGSEAAFWYDKTNNVLTVSNIDVTTELRASTIWAESAQMNQLSVWSSAGVSNWLNVWGDLTVTGNFTNNNQYITNSLYVSSNITAGGTFTAGEVQTTNLVVQGPVSYGWKTNTTGTLVLGTNANHFFGTNDAFTIAFSGTPQEGQSVTLLVSNTATTDFNITLPPGVYTADVANTNGTVGCKATNWNWYAFLYRGPFWHLAHGVVGNSATTSDVTAATNSATCTNWIVSRQPATLWLTNLSGTGALTNASAYQASSMVLSNIVGSGALTNASDFQASSMVLSNAVGTGITTNGPAILESSTNYTRAWSQPIVVRTNLAEASAWTLYLDRDNLAYVTNVLAQNATLLLTNAADAKFFNLRVKADGSARTVSVASGFTQTWISTNFTSDATNLYLPANKVGIISGQVWLDANNTVTNVDLVGAVQP